MESDGRGTETGTVTVNGIHYHVIKDERWKVTVNHEKVAENYAYLEANIEAHIIKHQKMTAWQQASYGNNKGVFKSIKDTSVRYGVCDIEFYVYNADDATCWRYYTHDDTYACNHESPWFSSEIKPSADHFKAWVISSIEVK
jgi:hypothetical protein